MLIHTGEPSFGLTQLQGSKGKKKKKKKKFTGGVRVPGPGPEPTARPSPSTRLFFVYSLLQMLFSACKSVQEAYYLMID